MVKEADIVTNNSSSQVMFKIINNLDNSIDFVVLILRNDLKWSKKLS